MKRLLVATLLSMLAATAAGYAQEPTVTIEPEKAVEAPKAKSWADKIELKGDFRLRQELIDEEGKDANYRSRIRARIGLKAAVYDDLDAYVQLATNADDPVSTNQTLTGGFSGKPVRFDLAYIDWHPAMVKSIHLAGGKMKNPFVAPGESELIWDHDLNPEGTALSLSRAFGNFDIFGNAAGFWVEQRDTEADSWLIGFQTGVKYATDKNVFYFIPGISYYNYTSIMGKAFIYDDAKSYGNSASPTDTYLYDYNLLEIFGEVGGKVIDIPVALFGDYVKNLAEGVTDDTGWLVGASVGKCKEPYSYAFRYNYRELESDAVLGVFTDSDFRGGGADGKGHEVGLDFQLTKNIKAGTTYFFDKKKISGGTDYQRFQFDLSFKI